jgi:hypothetical protein
MQGGFNLFTDLPSDALACAPPTARCAPYIPSLYSISYSFTIFHRRGRYWLGSDHHGAPNSLFTRLSFAGSGVEPSIIKFQPTSIRYQIKTDDVDECFHRHRPYKSLFYDIDVTAYAL